jgi:hypothetical protein
MLLREKHTAHTVIRVGPFYRAYSCYNNKALYGRLRWYADRAWDDLLQGNMR